MSDTVTIANVHPTTHLMTIPCNHCGMVNEVTPAAVFADGSASYGSAQDFCGYCENAMNYVLVWSEEPAKPGATTENTPLVTVEEKVESLLDAAGIASDPFGPKVEITLSDLEALVSKIKSLTPPF